MSKKHQITYTEPADRPVAIELSQGEIYALILHHQKQIKVVTRSAIKAIGENAKTKADIDSVRKEASRQISAHTQRAKGLSIILHTTYES
jgi:hypothetical protein